MPGLTVLLTNHTRGDRGGSDLFVRDVALSVNPNVRTLEAMARA
jgi:hypothetical protein